MLHGGFDLRRCAVCPTRGAEEKGATCAYRLRGGCSAVVSEPVSGLASSRTRRRGERKRERCDDGDIGMVIGA